MQHLHHGVLLIDRGSHGQRPRGKLGWRKVPFRPLPKNVVIFALKSIVLDVTCVLSHFGV